MRKIRLLLLWVLLAAFPMLSSSAQSYWTCDIHAFRYDMTLYCNLLIDGANIDCTRYEVAAFCGDECRGIAVLDTVNSVPTGFYLRIRSYAETGDIITFKAYDKTDKKILTVKDSLTFTSGLLTGYPSQPHILNIKTVMPGDANGDGKVSVLDVVQTTNYILGKAGTSFRIEAADLNGDGKITTIDIVKIINILLYK